MGIFFMLLFYKFYCCILFNQRYKFLSNLVRRIWIMYESILWCTKSTFCNIPNEIILLTPTGKTWFSFVFPYVYQILRKLLWNCTSSFIINILDIFLIFNKPMVDWDYGVIMPWCKWFLFNSWSRIQSKKIFLFRITKIILKKYFNLSMFSLWYFGYLED